MYKYASLCEKPYVHREERRGKEEEEEVYEITIKKRRVYVTNETDGSIYAILQDDDIGDEIGKFKSGKAFFY